MIGETLTTESADPCYCGLHASERVMSAWKYYNGQILCRVVLGDDYQDRGDKAASTSRTCLDMRLVNNDDISDLERREDMFQFEFDRKHDAVRLKYHEILDREGERFSAAIAPQKTAFDDALIAGKYGLIDRAREAYDIAVRAADAGYREACAPGDKEFAIATDALITEQNAVVIAIELAWYGTLSPAVVTAEVG